VVPWRSETHRLDHYGRHRGELGTRSVEEYDASAQEAIEIGIRFTYRDRRTQYQWVGYYHRDTARFVGVDTDGYIVTHHRLDEDDMYGLTESTYWDARGTMMTMETNTTQAPRSDDAVATASAQAAIEEIYSRLVGIHASVAESLSTDPTVVPWVEDELKSLLSYVRTARRATRG